MNENENFDFFYYFILCVIIYFIVSVVGCKIPQKNGEIPNFAIQPKINHKK